MMTSGGSFERLVTPVIMWCQRSREQLQSIIYHSVCVWDACAGRSGPRDRVLRRVCRAIVHRTVGGPRAIIPKRYKEARTVLETTERELFIDVLCCSNGAKTRPSLGTVPSCPSIFGYRSLYM